GDALTTGDVANRSVGAIGARLARRETRAERGLAHVGRAIERDRVVGRALRAWRRAVRGTDAGRRSLASIACAHRAGAGADALALPVAGAEAGIGRTAFIPQIDADRFHRAFAGAPEESARVASACARRVAAHAFDAEAGCALAPLVAADEAVDVRM